jgi:hypothetical protein
MLQDVSSMTQSTEQNGLDCENPYGSRSSSPDAVRIVTVHEFDGLQPHLQAWDFLAWESPQALGTMLPAWAEAIFRHGLCVARQSATLLQRQSGMQAMIAWGARSQSLRQAR